MFVFFFSFLSSIEFHHYSHSCWLWYTENEATQTSPPTPGKRNPQSVFPPSNSNIPLPHPHQSQGKPSSYMLSPRGEKKEKRKKEGKKNKPYKRKKRNTWKKHKVLKMWNLVRFVQVWSQYWPLWGSVCLSIQVIIIIFIEHWTGASSTRTMAWTTAACSTGGKPERKHFYLFLHSEETSPDIL